MFWGLTRTEEQGHLRALTAFSVGPVKQIEVEDMDYTYGDATRYATLAMLHANTRPSLTLHTRALAL